MLTLVLGYLELKANSNLTTKDKHERKFFLKPENHQMNIVNRTFYFTNSNAFTHASDLHKLLMKREKLPAVLVLTSDNGTDFCPNNYLVFMALGRLWKLLKIDHLFACSFAPGMSKYNFIEMAWATMSKALAQITLVPDAAKYDQKNSNEMEQLFETAMQDLGIIWNNTKYAGKNVFCEYMKPNNLNLEKPFDDYDDVKEVLQSGRKSANHNKYKNEIKFLFRHCCRRGYYLHFKKCYKLSCEHCRDKMCPESFDILTKLDSKNDSIPPPILINDLYEGKHYPSLFDIFHSETLLKKMTELSKKRQEELEVGKCHFCSWEYETEADKTKHNHFCP